MVAMTWTPFKGASNSRATITITCSCGVTYVTSHAKEYVRYQSARRKGTPDLSGLCEKCWRAKQQEFSRDSLKSKYGVDNVSKIPEVHQKKIDTCRRNHGVDFPMQATTVQAKNEEACLKRYGRRNVFAGSQGTALAKQGMLSKFGRENIFQGAEGAAISREGLLRKHGCTNSMVIPGVPDKVRATMLERYGVPNAQLLPENIGKGVATFSETRKSDEYRSGVTSRMAENLTRKLPPGWQFIQPKYGDKKVTLICPTCQYAWNLELGTVSAAVQEGRLCCPNCKPASMIEKSVVDLLPSEYSWITRDRRTLTPDMMRDVGLPGVCNGLELDYLCAEKKVAIEINGIYFHSEQMLLKNHPAWTPALARRFHWFKWEACRRQGIRLIHIWETEVGPGLQAFIRNLMGCESDVIGARELEVDPTVDSEVANEFYRLHHLQGGGNGHTHVGLREKSGELRALMTFASPRNCRSSRDAILLQRFATRGRVVGAASRLIAHAPTNLDILSYSDNRYSSGGLYSRLGFTAVLTKGPDYFYVRGIRTFPKASKQKSVLIKEAIERGVDTSGTEFEIADRLKYLRCWDCGKTTWLLRRASDVESPSH